MKHITVVIPCYNEVGNVQPMAEAILALFHERLTSYDCSILFIDNASTDGTQEILRSLCANHPQIQVILNARNFGAYDSPYYALLQAKGDAAILMACDFQDPVECIPAFLEEWENGADLVAGVKTKSVESPLVYSMRTLFYRMLEKGSSVPVIPHFTGFGLYDRALLERMRAIDDPNPFLRIIASELAACPKTVAFTQPARASGKSHHRFSDLYRASLWALSTYTSLGMRLCTAIGIAVLVFSIILLSFSISKGSNLLMSGLYGLVGIALIFIGLLGELLNTVKKRTIHRPLVIEKERINDKEEQS